MLRIDEPFHGAVLDDRHGRVVDNGLAIRVTGRAGLHDVVTVNEQATERAGERFEAEVVLRDRETDILAKSTGVGGRCEHRVRVVWDRHSRPRYRFSMDDTSFCLRDIAQKQYASLFDCFFLAGLRDLNTRYGAKFVLNLYYETADGFTLPDFSDRYKAEWEGCSDWLKLALHARANDPNRPYQYTPAATLMHDLDVVEEQILRFAGEQSYSLPSVIHWGMTQHEAVRALADRGVKTLSGYFGRHEGYDDVHYFLDETRCDHLRRHDALKAFDLNMTFSKVDIVVNTKPIEQITPILEGLAADPNTARIMDIFTHEQYFWPFYSHHIPDHFERLDTAIRWVTEHGYEPTFLHEGVLGIEV